METIDKRRGKGPQRIQVKHIHVNKGGRALVGVVERGGAPTREHWEMGGTGPVMGDPAEPPIEAADAPWGSTTVHLNDAGHAAPARLSLENRLPGQDRVPEAVPITAGRGEDKLPDTRRSGTRRGVTRKPKRAKATPLLGESDCGSAGIANPDAPRSELDREPVGVAGDELPAADRGDQPREWSTALIAAQDGPLFFPAVDLGWSADNLKALHKRIGSQIYKHIMSDDAPMSIADAAKAWYLEPRSTEILDNIDSLLAFGFLEHSGEGSERKLRISEVGLRFARSSDGQVTKPILAEAARRPKLINDYLERWGAERPPEDLCISELKTAHGFTDKEAKRFLRVYDWSSFFAHEQEPDEPPAADGHEEPVVDRLAGSAEVERDSVPARPAVESFAGERQADGSSTAGAEGRTLLAGEAGPPQPVGDQQDEHGYRAPAIANTGSVMGELPERPIEPAEARRQSTPVQVDDAGDAALATINRDSELPGEDLRAPAPAELIGARLLGQPGK